MRTIASITSRAALGLCPTVSRNGHQGGFGLIEIVCALGIFGILTLALSSLLSYYAKNTSVAENTAAVGVSVREIELMLGQTGQCQANLRNTPVVMSTPVVAAPIAALTQFNFSNTAANQPLAKVGTVINGEIFDAIELVPIAQISQALVSVELRMTLRKTTTPQASALTRSLQLMAQVQGGKLQNCWVREARGTLVYSQVCSSATGGALDYYDQASGTCTVMNGKWFNGSRTYAGCPPGAHLPQVQNSNYDCAINLPSTFPDVVLATSATMTDSSSVPIGRPGAITGFQGNGCFCAYAVDIPKADSATAVCSVLCIVP